MAVTVLVVEDEAAYREPLEYSLSREGFTVVSAADGPDAIAKFQKHSIDVVLLDLMLPGMSGTEVCRYIRDHSRVPIIMVTAKDDVVDVVLGLELGADDYLTKPYLFRELLARIKAVLRRVSESEGPGEILKLGNIEMDVDMHQVRVAGQLVEFPLREFELLEYFLRHPKKVLPREQVMDRVWGIDWFGDPKTLDVHVKRLRAKVEEDPANPQIIVTVRGLGYRIIPPEA